MSRPAAKTSAHQLTKNGFKSYLTSDQRQATHYETFRTLVIDYDMVGTEDLSSKELREFMNQFRDAISQIVDELNQRGAKKYYPYELDLDLSEMKTYFVTKDRGPNPMKADQYQFRIMLPLSLSTDGTRSVRAIDQLLIETFNQYLNKGLDPKLEKFSTHLNYKRIYVMSPYHET